MNLKTLVASLALLPISLISFTYGQDESGGEQSPAETSVTGSSSEPVVNAPSSNDSNPIISIVRLGLPIESALTFALTDVFALASSSKDFSTFLGASELVASGVDLNFVTTGLDLGVSVLDIKSANVAGLSSNDLVTSITLGLSIDQLIDATAKGIDLTTYKDLVDSGASTDPLLSSYADTFKLTDITKLIASIETVIAAKSDTYAVSDFQVALNSAVTVANSLLKDVVVTSSLPTPITVSTLTSNGYNYELVRLLVEYGAIGSKGSSLANEILGESYSSFSSTGSLSAFASTSGYLTYLKTLTGSATFGDIDSESSVLSVPTDNIMLAPGSNITIGQTSTSSTIDVKDLLTTSNGVDEKREILIVGAAKDLNVAGDVTFTNATNDVEDHALVLGAADEVKVDGSDITYTGSNLAIGAGGDDLTKESNMYLHNTIITTGGNLAAGTLGKLSISSANFTVGNGGKNSDPDNVYLYANELIQVNGLGFSGSRLDDVYMEAITINLKDVEFPHTADVILKSRDGSLHFDSYSAPIVGGVNMTNVSHGITTLNSGHFDGVPGHHDSSIRLPNGKAAVKIRKQY